MVRVLVRLVVRMRMDCWGRGSVWESIAIVVVVVIVFLRIVVLRRSWGSWRSWWSWWIVVAVVVVRRRTVVHWRWRIIIVRWWI